MSELEKCTLENHAKALEDIMLDRLLAYFREHREELLEKYEEPKSK